MMSELRKVPTPVSNTMTVLEQGDEKPRPCSGTAISRKPLKKTTSEGLISLSPEPGKVKFEVETNTRPGSGGSRCGSANRVERKLQAVKKKEEVEEQTERAGSVEGNRILTPCQPADLPAMKQHKSIPSQPPTAAEERPATGKPIKPDPETSEDSSESDSESSDSESEEKPLAPIEMKGEFMKHVMDEDYAKAKELCKKILLIEPDNSVCIEFHGLIEQKLEQESEENSDDGDSSDDDDSDEDSDDDEENDQDDDDDDESSSDEESDSESDDDFVPPPGLNLIMGGLPINPPPKQP